MTKEQLAEYRRVASGTNLVSAIRLSECLDEIERLQKEVDYLSRRPGAQTKTARRGCSAHKPRVGE